VAGCPVKGLDCPGVDWQALAARGPLVAFQVPGRDLQQEAGLVWSGIVRAVRAGGMIRPGSVLAGAALPEADADLAPELVPGPAVLFGLAEPELLLRLGEGRDLGVMGEAQGVPPAGQPEPPGRPRVVAQGLVVQAGSRESLP
jgi:hypothetical protein